MKRLVTLSRPPMLVVAGGVLIALVTSIGWMSSRTPAGSTEQSFVAEIEKITDSLFHLLEGDILGQKEKKTVGAGIRQPSPQRRSSHRVAGLP